MRLYLTGGFLGSGKTTAIRQACALLGARGLRPAAVTNDQGAQLVDTALLQGEGIAAREVTDGCFCCHFPRLEEALQSLQGSERPDAVFAESVGSCTDIVATVVKPLRRDHPELPVVLSVFADALRLLSMARGQALFADPDIRYLFDKQLEEGDLLVISKWDLLDEGEKAEVRAFAEKRFGGRPLLFLHMLDQADVARWLEKLEGHVAGERASLDIDYQQYGNGEAKLAWLDRELEIRDAQGAEQTATALINAIYGQLQHRRLPIGHLKFLLRSPGWQRKVSFTSLVEPPLRQTSRPAAPPELTLLINARVQAEPATLEALVTEAAAAMVQQRGCAIRTLSNAAFQPGFPRPTHRITD